MNRKLHKIWSVKWYQTANVISATGNLSKANISRNTACIIYKATCNDRVCVGHYFDMARQESTFLEFLAVFSATAWSFNAKFYAVIIRAMGYQQHLTPSTPAVQNCCCSKGSAPYWSNPPFLIFDIRALWRSVLSARAPECQKLKMVG